MSNIEHRELLESALGEIQQLRQQRDQLLEGRSEPVAIIGMACRFPGASNPDELWHVSNNAVDCIGRVPPERWDADKYFDPSPNAPGKVVTSEGGFLPDVRGFDATFFGISPREARSMDPQQRMLLEVTWEAIERAAIASDTLYGSEVGVYLGLSNLEYQNIIRASGDATLIDGYFGTGNAASVAAGRIAYTFGFKGPAMTVDTACSSSLVAIHQAIASLRRKECRLAISGGINLMLTPETFIHFSNARMLATDGRCKSFSAQANGYGRGEGCGIVVLKLLSDALTDEDPIDAIIAGSACNHDGRSAGLTAPNGPSQEAVIRSALKDAKLQPHDVQFVEAHGTGTPLGDPIEAGALARVYGADRSEAEPLLVATIKSNIGHAEGAAGVAGLIHACMCLKHRRIPPLLHLRERNPHIDQRSLHFTTIGVELPLAEHPLRAGVSSFGFSGTNAHVILQRPTGTVEQLKNHNRNSSWGQPLFVLSAKTEMALRQQAERFRLWMESHREITFADVCHTLQSGRNHFEQRLAFGASSVSDAVECLGTYLAGDEFETVRITPLASAFISGEKVDWPATHARRIALPTYAFQHEPYWIRSIEVEKTNSMPLKAPRQFLGFSCSIDADAWRSLSDHRLFGAGVMPAVAWLDIAHRAANSNEVSAFCLKNIRFAQMMVVGSASSPVFETRFLDSPRQNSFGIFIPKEGVAEVGIDSAFVSGQVIDASPDEWLGGDLVMSQGRCGDEVDPKSVYDRFNSIGFDYGPNFRRLTRLSVGENSAIGELHEEHYAPAIAVMSRYGLLDSALHVIAGAAWKSGYEATDATAFLPAGIQSIQWFDCSGSPTWSMALIRSSSDEYAIEADVFIWNDHKQPMMQLIGVRFEGFAANKQVITDRPMIASLANEAPSEQLTTAKLLAMPEAVRLPTLQEHLRQKLAHELEIPVDNLLPDQPLSDFGLDSLIVFRLGIQLESEFGFALNSLAMMQGQSLRALSESLLWRLTNLTSGEEKGFESSVSI